MSIGYHDVKGTHIRASTNGICETCDHNIGKHYFLNKAEYAHCNVGMIFKCKCKSLRKKNWEEPKIIVLDRISESD